MTDDERISLREYLEKAFRDHEQTHVMLSQAIDRALASQERNREANAEAVERTFEGHRLMHDAHDSAHAREHVMVKDALDKADTSLEKRLEGMNEVRAQLRDQAGTFARKEDLDALEKAMVIRHQSMQSREDEQWKNYVVRHDALLQRIIEIEKRGASMDSHLGTVDGRTLATEQANDRLEARVQEIEKRNSNLDGKIAMLGVGLTLVVIVVNVGLRLLAAS